MDLDTPAIVAAVLPHGEHGAVVRFLTERDGLIAGYVPGGRSRTLRPVLQPGNGVAVRFRARTASQLASAAVELVRGRTVLATARASAAALDWLCALTATVLSEASPSPRLYAALDGLLDAMTFADGPMQWLPGVVRYELLLLAELGFGLDLSACASTGATDDLAFVSPKSSQAVGRAAGTPYAAKLLPLPAFLLDGGATTSGDIADGLRTTGWFLERDVLTGRAAGLLAARQRLVAMV
jgi:DNA repair protein RecO (recombination protein O)